MSKPLCVIMLLFTLSVLTATAQEAFERDIIETSEGDLEITFIAHGTLMFEFKEKIIHVDPVGQYADYTTMPKADIIMITHEHGDHLDPEVVDILRTDQTDIILTAICAERIEGNIVMNNGNVQTVQDLKIEAVPAYNLEQGFHPKGNGNGYVVTFGDKKIYIAGDTENIPEMKELSDIDIAFLPMNLPFTMSPQQVADAALSFKPKILYPYHYGNTDPSELVDLLQNVQDIEVRIRQMQ